MKTKQTANFNKFIERATSGKDKLYPEFKNWDYIGIYRMGNPNNWSIYYSFCYQNMLKEIYDLIEQACCKDAPHDDLVRILKYVVVVVKSKEYNLDISKAYNDMGIAELMQKYNPM